MKTIKILFIVLFLTSCSKDWGYEGASGPKYWGELKEEYKFCKIGYNQSPIDIDFKSIMGRYVVKDNGLEFFYSDASVLKEKGVYDVKFSFDRKDYFTLHKREYYLKDIQFHHPSEHLVNGESQVLEMQAFHKSDSEQLAVIALFVKVGEENVEINKLIELLENKEDEAWSEFNFGKVLKGNKSFFYDGSLTVPPCTEGVKWYVMRELVEMSKEQVSKIIKLALDGKANVRPVQDFNPELY